MCYGSLRGVTVTRYLVSVFRSWCVVNHENGGLFHTVYTGMLARRVGFAVHNMKVEKSDRDILRDTITRGQNFDEFVIHMI